ncbi:MAG: glycosyltransferase [Chloroflexota bacterium]
MKTALVHDWLNQIGGAEDVLEVLVDMFPSAPLYTSIYYQKKMPAHYRDWEIHTSFINRLPFAQKVQQLYFPIYPMAFDSFDFRNYDLVLSNKSGFCHGIITEPETLHICYCLTPTRYLWRYNQYSEREKMNPILQNGLLPFLHYLRIWDRLAADRVDHFIAISEAVRRRIVKFYRRDAEIIYPPVDTTRFSPIASHEIEDYYLFVGRLVPYRRLDLLIEAFNKLKKPLFIAGSGRDRERLESLANSNVNFLGFVSDEELPKVIARAKAFIWPGEEDFGIAPIQAMAAGRPVIAYAAGGALDTVLPNKTGVLFNEQTVACMIEAVNHFESLTWQIDQIIEHAEKFDTELFKKQLNDFIDKKFLEHRLNLKGKGTAI